MKGYPARSIFVCGPVRVREPEKGAFDETLHRGSFWRVNGRWLRLHPISLDDGDCRRVLEAIPAAIYATDPDGRITFCNRTAVAMLGRIPDLSNDRWCVSWRMYRSDGTPLPHEECPMATALKEGKAVRGVEVIVERPDGSRAYVMPYPTPIFDNDGTLKGGVNFVLDISDRRRAERAAAHLAAIVPVIRRCHYQQGFAGYHHFLE